MVVPSISLTYLAVLALLYGGLALVVVALRIKGNVPFGHGADDLLQRAIRIHGNFAEWVPLTALLVAALEALGEAGGHIHLLMGALLAARILHPIGLFSRIGTASYRIGRIAGALTTWIVLMIAAILLLLRL
ncbi:MAG TPA: MAPEG family protein [Burkholderiaceae bacterium]|nr:MAPEG family protein [Burkholderiaceae bacterium]